MRGALFAASLLVAACGNDPDDSIDPVPPPSAESTNRLMAEAEAAASNAQNRISQSSAPDRPNQGEPK